MKETRKLAAILVADVVGYSRLAGADEDRILARLRALRSDLIDPTIAVHHGRVVKRTGDGAIIEFRSVVDAVRCAIDLQRGMAAVNSGTADDRNIVLRIGVNLGDVMVEGGDLYGDGINIAARLETLAEPGGILVSGTAYAHIKNNIKAGFDDLGVQALKNIAEPVRVYRVTGTPAVTPAAPGITSDKPSIAVLPFTNMSGDPEQEYFSDGMTEDIISGLARLHWLFVIARNSTFTFKGKAVDVKHVGRQLGVRYVLEGSVRKAGDRVRITSQLIDAATGAHIWADRFDGPLSDIFELQDRVTANVIGAIEPKLRNAEIERARHKPTESVDAYDLFLRALPHHNSVTQEGNQEALRLLERAIEIDPNYASAYGLAVYCYMRQRTSGWVPPMSPLNAEGIRLANLAAKNGPDDPEALWRAGFALAMLAGETDDALALIERSLILNPNSANAWMASGFVRGYSGDSPTAIGHLEQSARLSPLDPLAFIVWHGLSFAHFAAGRYDEASIWADRILREAPNFPAGLRQKASICGLRGQRDEGRKYVQRLLAVSPHSTLTALCPFFQQIIKIPDCVEAALDGLREAGLPE